MNDPILSYLFYYQVAMIILVPMNAIWAYRDARTRGYSGLLITLFVVLVPFPLGVFLWLIFRPKLPDQLTQNEAGAESLSENSTDADAALKQRANAGHL